MVVGDHYARCSVAELRLRILRVEAVELIRFYCRETREIIIIRVNCRFFSGAASIMVAGLRSGDRHFPSSSGLSTSRSVSKGARATVSEKTPLLPRISSQERQSNAGGVTKSKLPEYEIPFWQNQPMWSTGLFDCCADVPMCCFTIFFPCFAFGRNAEVLDGEKNSCWTAAAVWWALQHTIALGCLYSSSYRGRLRAKYNIPEGPVPDSVIHCLCWPCAFCQEHREIHYRSFGPEFWGPSSVTVAPSQQRFTEKPAKRKPLLQ